MCLFVPRYEVVVTIWHLIDDFMGCSGHRIGFLCSSPWKGTQNTLHAPKMGINAGGLVSAQTGAPCASAVPPVPPEMLLWGQPSACVFGGSRRFWVFLYNPAVFPWEGPSTLRWIGAQNSCEYEPSPQRILIFLSPLGLLYPAKRLN